MARFGFRLDYFYRPVLDFEAPRTGFAELWTAAGSVHPRWADATSHD